MFKKKFKKVIVIMLSFLFALTVVKTDVYAENDGKDRITQEDITETIPDEDENKSEIKESGSSYARGYANILDKDTLIISLFVNTKEKIWTDSSMEETLNKLDTACKFLENEAAVYGKEVRFQYDWSSNSSLRYRTWVNFEASDSNFESKVDDRIAFFIDRVIDYEGLQIKYDVDNVFTILFFNDAGRSYAICYDGEDIPEETLILFNDSNPAVYAHEMLHLFGAHDYYSNAEYQEATVSYIKSAYPEDIMLKTSYENGRIQENIGRLTAYHLGWVNDAPSIYEYEELLR